MKRILPLLLVFACLSMTQAQSKIEKEENKDSEMSITLEEVEIVAYGSRKSCNTTYCYSTTTTECYSEEKNSGCNFKMKGIAVETISSNEIKDVKLYPNPSSNGIFQIRVDEKYSSIEIAVNSISGQSVLSEKFQNITNKVSVDLSNYPSGIYILNIIADGKVLSTKKAIVR
ncbi:T9SS type A sorting domain-containing protein [uncultured Lacinutrix sp.]|uniref:T9SS type A sorting domain-containing protein n=1 Tax=uncultured Lacinutrix sp. TaxID=574032 RepID=UPI0026176A19|nr:T9SS type A sorting domain-containing protein [uncultured Lacinutrix sp.]